MIERDSEESKKIIAMNEDENMKVDTTYLRVLFYNKYIRYLIIWYENYQNIAY